MGDDTRRHAARRRWFGRGRTRALLSLGVLACLGVTATSAYWTDSATLTGGTITSASMDLQLQVPRSSSTWEFAGAGGSLTDTTLAVADLAPGESQAFNMAARNVGSPTFAYTASVSQAGGWTFVGDPITVRFFAGASARASNTATFPRSGTCTGTALGTSPVAVAGTATTVVPARSLASGASEQLCLVVAMATTAGNDNQSKTGSLLLSFTATQATS